jgi:hypothetical protein
VSVDLKEAKEARQRVAARKTDPRQIKQAGFEDSPWRKAGA